MMQDKNSLINSLKSLSLEQLQSVINDFSEDEAHAIYHDWNLWARPEQKEPVGDWNYWLICAGRGFGKTRCGSEWVIQKVKTYPIVNLIGTKADAVRDVMIEGESGILACANKWDRPRYKKSSASLEWPNGAKSLLFSAEEPDSLRGPQSYAIWADEIAAWKYPAAWEQAKFGLRLGQRPQAVITTTPRPTPIIKTLIKDPACFVTRGTTYDNRANLAPSFFAEIIKSYEGTRLGRQELNAEILEDNPNALFNLSLIETTRVETIPFNLVKLVIGVDPAVTSNESSDETGIIVAALGNDGHGYIIDDCSMSGLPAAWAAEVVRAYDYYRADRVIAEVNNGGDLVESVIRTAKQDISYTKVHASRGKAKRAEPISALYEQRKIHHIGIFSKLEDQMCNFDPLNPDPNNSPDRMDALVWALTALFDDSSYLTFGAI